MKDRNIPQIKMNNISGSWLNSTCCNEPIVHKVYAFNAPSPDKDSKIETRAEVKLPNINPTSKSEI